MESKPKVGKGQGYADGGRVPGREMDRLPTKKPPGRGKDLAPARRFKGKYEGYAEGGPVAELDAGQPDYVPPKMSNTDDLPFDRSKYNNWYEDPRYIPQAPPYDPDRYISPEIPVDLPPIGALTPLPEEPNYGPGANLDSHYRLNPPEELPPPIGVPLPQKPIYTDGPGKAIDFLDFYREQNANRVGNRRAMMGDRRDMAMRPGMRGVARRAAPARMRAPSVDLKMQPYMPTYDAQPPAVRRNPLDPVGPSMYAKGGEVRSKKIGKVMREYKEGKLHSGSKKGPVVKNPKQAMAIALSEARAAKKADGGRVEKLKKSIIADDLAKARKLGKTYNEMYKDEFNKQVKEGILNPSAVKAKKAYELYTPKEVRKVYESDKEYFEKMASQNKKAEGGVMSKGPKTRYTAAKGRRMSKERAMERRALDKARHAEKYAPGLSLDMEDESMVREGKMLKYAKGGKAKHSDVKMDKAVVKKAVHKHEKAMHPGKPMTKLNKGGVPSYGRKPMYGGGKC
jgi:hypothetical protein